METLDNDIYDKDEFVFTRDSTLLLGSAQLTKTTISSIRVHCSPGVAPPFRFGHIDVDKPNSCRVWIVDSDGKKVAAWSVSNIVPNITGIPSCPLRDENNIIRGHIAYEQSAVSIILNEMNRTTGQFALAANAFVLSPACLQPIPNLGMRAIRIGETTTVAPVVLAPGPGLIVSSGREPSIGVFKLAGYSDNGERKNGFLWLSMDNVDTINNESTDPTSRPSGSALGRRNRLYLDGVNLMFRHGITSNIRVLNTADGIELKGVTDA